MGAERPHSYVGAWRPSRAGCRESQTRLVVHIESSAIIMCHLLPAPPPKPLGPGEMTVTSVYKWIFYV